MTRHAHRWALAGVTLLALTACTPDEPAVTPAPSADATGTPSPTPTGDDAAPEDAVLDVYHRYWAAAVEAQAGNPDPALFADSTAGEQLEVELSKAREYQDLGIVIEGEPVITDVDVELDDESAVVSACVDYTGWVAAEMEAESVGVVPTSLRLDRIDGAWFVTDYVPAPDDLTC